MSLDYKRIPAFRGGVLLAERTAPSTPASGLMAVYAGTDSRLHIADDNGLDRPIGLTMFPLTVSDDLTIPAGWSGYVSPSLEVANGVTFEVANTGVMEIG